MRLEEARKLAMLGPLGNPLYAASLKEANDMDLALERHCCNHFDEVVEALEQMVFFAERNGMRKCHDEPQAFCEVCVARQVLDKAKEVK
jgi:hypothetical protein